MKTWFWSMLFLAVMLQLGACSSTQTIESKQEEDKQTVKKRVPFRYHKHFEERNQYEPGSDGSIR